MGLSDLLGDKIQGTKEKTIKINDDKIRETISYLYLPVEANDEHFLNLHSEAFIKLSKQDIKNQILKFISDKGIRNEIRQKVDGILDAIKQELQNEYEYKERTRTAFSDKKILDLVISEYLKAKRSIKKQKQKMYLLPLKN